jgi:hypothetical protein
MMTNGETAATPELHPPLQPPLPPLPGDVNDALRKAYGAAKNTVELRPVIDQTILNAARENARQSIPFYKKIPWYTQFSMAGAVFGSLLLSAVVLYKTVVHKHDKAIEELVMAEVAVKNEDARKKAPMVVSILAETNNTPAAALAPAEPVAKITTAIEPAKPVIMAAAAPLPETKTEIVASAPSVQSITTVVELKPAAKADTDTATRAQDKIVMADATALSKDLSRRRMEAIDSPKQAGSASNALKAKEANIVVGQLAPPPTAPAPAAVRALAPQIIAAPAAPAVLAAPPAAPPLGAAGTVPVEAAPAWLSRIEVLQRAGKNAQAKTELQALLRRYPDTVLTTELKRLLAD